MSPLLYSGSSFGAVRTGTSASPRTLVVSDLRLFADAVAHSLASAASCSHGEVDGALAETTPDVAVVDLAGTAVIATLATVRAAARAGSQRPPTIVGLVRNGDPGIVVGAVGFGVRVFVDADQSVVDLAGAVEAAASGATLCPPSVATVIFSQVARGDQAIDPAEVLSPREREVARYLALGLSNKEIASRLVIELATVKHHVHSVLRKLGVRRRAEVPALFGGLNSDSVNGS
jgi:DNA-binding NarL/FixJ family response regulator